MLFDDVFYSKTIYNYAEHDWSPLVAPATGGRGLIVVVFFFKMDVELVVGWPAILG